MKATRTNWQRFFDDQIKDVKFRSLVEKELRTLRIGAQIAALRDAKKSTQTLTCGPGGDERAEYYRDRKRS